MLLAALLPQDQRARKFVALEKGTDERERDIDGGMQVGRGILPVVAAVRSAKRRQKPAIRQQARRHAAASDTRQRARCSFVIAAARCAAQHIREAPRVSAHARAPRARLYAADKARQRCRAALCARARARARYRTVRLLRCRHACLPPPCVYARAVTHACLSESCCAARRAARTICRAHDVAQGHAYAICAGARGGGALRGRGRRYVSAGALASAVLAAREASRNGERGALRYTCKKGVVCV